MRERSKNQRDLPAIEREAVTAGRTRSIDKRVLNGYILTFKLPKGVNRALSVIFFAVR